MADASFVQSSFLGGEWAKSMQGRIDRPDYRTALNVCLNGLPLDTGAWTRRPGFAYAAHTRNGTAGRLITFNFQQSAPYTIELTDSKMRFFAGAVLAKTNDEVAVSSISTATPAVVTTASSHGWSSGDEVMLSDLGLNNPLLHNRQFIATVTAADKLSLADAVTGSSIDGSTLGTFVSGNISRIYEFTSPYTALLWQDVRLVQSERQTPNGSNVEGVLLHGSVKPYVLSVETVPTDTEFATFTLGAANIKDGPYFDAVPGGTLATPSALIGNITLNLSFNAYDATRSYAIGDYVASSSVNYKSLTDANVGNTPASSPTNWLACSAADAISSTGFAGSDVGRHVRLYSEPALWVSGATYTAGTSVVSYGDVVYKCISSNTAGSTNTPSTAPTIWSIYPTGAIWTWGKITGLSNIINRSLAGSVSLGNMTSGGGNDAVFNGSLSQAAASSAEKSGSGTIAALGSATLSSYVGKDYSGASNQTIGSATVYPSSDKGLAIRTSGFVSITSATINLRGKATAPSSATDGTLLGTAVGPVNAPISVVSSDQTTAWKYVWVEMVTTIENIFASSQSYNVTNVIGQLSFFSPAGSGVSQGVTVQIIGDALLYTTPIRTWRLGLFSDTTGWPSCGTYHEGRLWLTGAVKNRIDASKSNDIYNFAPTGTSGAVADNNGISYTFNASDVNEIYWMNSDDRGVLCGTQAGEWLVAATTANAPLTPTSIQAHRVTTIGCANIEPRRTGLTLTFVQRHKRRLMEYFADVYSGRFSSPNLTLTAKHLTEPGIAEIAYQQELAPVVWQRLDDGSLIGVTYKRESLSSAQGPTFAGHHRHSLGSERTIESICVGPSSDGTLDALAMVTTSDSGVRHVEFLTKHFEETDDLVDAWFLDDAITPSAYHVDGSNLTLYGLWHLNDESVTVFAGGIDCGEVTVTSGTATVALTATLTSGFISAFDGAMPIVVGFTYTSDGQIVRPATPQESGARNGPAIAKKRRTEQYGAMLVNTQAISFGTQLTSARLKPAKLATAGQTLLAATVLYSGTHWDSLQDDYSFDSMVCWRVSRPFPATVAAISAFLQTQDK